MRMTQADHDARVARLTGGQGTDDDRRLVKLFESQDRDDVPAENASVSHAPDHVVELDDGGQGVEIVGEAGPEAIELPTGSRVRRRRAS